MNHSDRRIEDSVLAPLRARRLGIHAVHESVVFLR